MIEEPKKETLSGIYTVRSAELPLPNPSPTPQTLAHQDLAVTKRMLSSAIAVEDPELSEGR